MRRCARVDIFKGSVYAAGMIVFAGHSAAETIGERVQKLEDVVRRLEQQLPDLRAIRGNLVRRDQKGKPVAQDQREKRAQSAQRATPAQ